MADSDELLTVDEVAERVKVNPETVRRWIKSERLPAVKPAGGPYRIHSADLDRLFGATPKAQAPLPFEGEASAERRVLISSWAHHAESLRERMQKLLDGLPVLPDNKIVLADKRARIVELQNDFWTMQRTLVESGAAEAIAPYFLALTSGEYVPSDVYEEIQRFRSAQRSMMMDLVRRGDTWISQAEEAIKAAPEAPGELSQGDAELSPEVTNWIEVSS